MLIYDATRPGCAALAEIARSMLPLGMPVLAWDEVPDLDALGLRPHDLAAQPWWIGVDGVPRSGAAAVSGCLGATRRWWSPLARLLAVPGISTLTMVSLGVAGRLAAHRSAKGSSRTA